MVKKVVELEEGTERIVMSEYASVDDKAIDYPNGDRDVLVESLPDAPELRKIELPVDLIEDFEEDRGQYSNICEFLREVDIYELSESLKIDSFDRFIEAYKIASEFYLGYVHFVPKEEHMYMVAVDMHDQAGNLKPAHAWKNNRHGGVTPYIDEGNLPSAYYNYNEFSEEEADRIVKGLSSLNARKVQVEDS